MLAADAKNTMWCKQCQQDVPGVVSEDEGQYCCPRCGDKFADPPVVIYHPSVASPESVSEIRPHPSKACGSERSANPSEERASPEPAPIYDGWELDEHLRHAQRVIALSGEVSLVDGQEPDRDHFRLDSAHSGPAGWRPGTPSRHDRRRKTPSAGGETLAWKLTWTVLSLGLAAFVCGGVLLGWSIVGQRQELWTIGAPITLVGLVGLLAGLLAGLILQLERLWHENHDTATKLDRVDRQLREMKAGAPAGDESRFDAVLHAHPAEEMGPMRLLADLKDQFDILSRKLDETEARGDHD